MSEDEMRLDELLGAYALDAVSDEERREIEQYLAVNPRARAEVEAHREVATMLAWSGTAAPEGLWERIAGQLESDAPKPAGELAAVLAFDPVAARQSGVERRPARRSRLARTGLAWVGAAAAAAVVAVLAVGVIGDDDDSRSPLESAVAAARSERGSSTATLRTADGQPGADVVIDPEGHGYLLADALPELPADRTYQLWGVIEGKAISLGVLGRAPHIETFTVDGPLSTLVITNEVAGGVISDGNPEGAFLGDVG
jgi:anti-sigma-K factor RskA